jgi:hypothetical protein
MDQTQKEDRRLYELWLIPKHPISSMGTADLLITMLQTLPGNNAMSGRGHP